MDIFDLVGAQAFSGISCLGREEVAASQAVGRVVAERVEALADNPLAAESLRDGFVVCLPGMSQGDKVLFTIVGEIAAGSSPRGPLAPGCACRIFTGGLIPAGGERVVAQEECSRLGEMVAVGREALQGKRSFIKAKGSDFGKGEVLLERGVRLGVDHLVALTASGVETVKAARRPRTAVFCTGSELVAAGEPLVGGRKLSVNTLLLHHLLPRYGAEVVEQGLVVDKAEAVAAIFARVRSGDRDLAVTTGGMGPGKYDLVEQAFADAGGKVLFDHLPMLPGRSILCGLLGATLVVALPGPPYAVRTLIHELVGPLLLLQQGAADYRPQTITAMLTESCRLRAGDLLQVKAGVLTITGTTCTVRPAASSETISCFMLFPPGRQDFLPGTVIEVHPVAGAGHGGV
jgi:molybdopterin molybdotransferase